MRHHFLMGVVCFGVSLSAQAQRRDGGGALPTLEVQLSQAVRFGESVVLPGRYRLSVSPESMAFANPTSMVVSGSAPVQVSSGTNVAAPTVEVLERGNEVEIVVRSQSDVYRARGQKVAAKAATTTPALESKAERTIADPTPAAETDVMRVEGVLKRYESSVAHCGEKAPKSHWTTDDPRFNKCVCPMAEKWKFPKIAASLRIHRVLAKGRAGYSLTVTPDGKNQDCRVWVGSRSPEEPAPAVVESPAAMP